MTGIGMRTRSCGHPECPMSDQSTDLREDPGQWARRAGNGRFGVPPTN
jgi:hypothetical protein